MHGTRLIAAGVELWGRAQEGQAGLRTALALPTARLRDRKVCPAPCPSLLVAFLCPLPVPGLVSAAGMLCSYCWHTAVMVRSNAASFPHCGSHPCVTSHNDVPFPIEVPIF